MLRPPSLSSTNLLPPKTASIVAKCIPITVSGRSLTRRAQLVPGRNLTSSSSHSNQRSQSAATTSTPADIRDHDLSTLEPEVTQDALKTEPLTGSAKLFAEAEEEERELDRACGTKGRRTMSNIQRMHNEKLQFKHPNWMGDESTEDAVLRMLVDKYKPLRSGTTQTAEEKVRKELPKTSTSSVPIAEDSVSENPLLAALEARIGAVEIKVDAELGGYQVKSTPTAPTQPTLTGSWATEPLLPSNPHHNPWDTTFKPPTEFTEAPSIKHATLVSTKKPGAVPGPDDSKQKKKERDQVKKSRTAGRLGQAKEATLDYRLGLKGGSAGDAERVGPGRVNPSSMKGWTSLVEDRIQKARKAGAFNNVQGRGKPIIRSTEEQNPFIDREEFIMNRIVQRNGAAPIWVELQTELEESLNSFRSVLMESWVRTASTSISADLSPPNTNSLKLPSAEWVARYRDRGWEQRELGYHSAAIKEINNLVRKYNGMAPYPVRRTPYTLEAERDMVYKEGVGPIVEALRQRGREGRLGSRGSSAGSSGDAGGKPLLEGGVEAQPEGWSLGEMFRATLRRLFGQPLTHR